MQLTSPRRVVAITGVLAALVLGASVATAVLGGIEVLVSLLKQSRRMTEKTIIEALEDNEPELAEQIKRQETALRHLERAASAGDSHHEPEERAERLLVECH